MDHLLANAAGSVTLTVTDSFDAPTDLDSVPTATVYNGAGVSISTGPASKTDTGTYTYTFTPTILDDLTITWVGTLAAAPVTFTTTARSVGAIPLTPAEVRGTDEDLSDEVNYSTANVVRAIAEAWDQAERSMRVAVVPSGYRGTIKIPGYRGTIVPGLAQCQLALPKLALRRVVSLSVDGTDWDVAGISIIDPIAGVVEASSVFPPGSQIDYYVEHGWDFPPPRVVRALRLHAIEQLIPSTLPARATSINTDTGAYRLTTAGRDGDTGLPEVDAIYERFGLAAIGSFG